MNQDMPQLLQVLEYLLGDPSSLHLSGHRRRDRCAAPMNALLGSDMGFLYSLVDEQTRSKLHDGSRSVGFQPASRSGSGVFRACIESDERARS